MFNPTKKSRKTVVPKLVRRHARPKPTFEMFESMMVKLREMNRPFHDALVTVLRMDEPQRDAALLLMRSATEKRLLRRAA